MKIKLVEDPFFCSECHARLSGIRLLNPACRTCAMRCHQQPDETHDTPQQMRLLASRDAVLRDIGPREMGGSEW